MPRSRTEAGQERTRSTRHPSSIVHRDRRRIAPRRPASVGGRARRGPARCRASLALPSRVTAPDCSEGDAPVETSSSSALGSRGAPSGACRARRLPVRSGAVDFRTESVVGLARRCARVSSARVTWSATRSSRSRRTTRRSMRSSRWTPNGARSAATVVDDRIASGVDPGPFAGIPIGVKDLEDAAGYVTTHGSKAFAAGPPRERQLRSGRRAWSPRGAWWSARPIHRSSVGRRTPTTSSSGRR